MGDEWRVEVELREEGHALNLLERLRTQDLEDEAQQRLGNGVIITRDGARMFVYAGSEQAAREAERVVRELAEAEGIEAVTQIERWDPGDRDWEEISASAAAHVRDHEHEGESVFAHPAWVYLGAHKPEILRDLGL